MNERLEAIRSEKHRQGLSDTQLADMCDLSHSTVSRAFSGKTEPSEYTHSTQWKLPLEQNVSVQKAMTRTNLWTV